MASRPATNFEEAINVVPLSSHTYAANLGLEWCIGTVPNGGYITALFYNVARTHMRHTHPSLHDGDPNPIALHLSFLRRTEAGRATLRVEDTKLGARTSTLHIVLSQQQPPPGKGGIGGGKGGGGGSSGSVARDEVAAYITCSNIASERGPDLATTYELIPPPPAGGKNIAATSSSGGADGQASFPGADLARLSRDGNDGTWARYAVSFSSMRGASKNVEFFVPAAGDGGATDQARRGFVEQWMRFRPLGKLARWTDAAVGFLIDMFPMVLESFDDEPWNAEEKKEAGTGPGVIRQKDVEDVAAAGAGNGPKYWYPTVALNVDFKKKLPPEGVEWLYSRVQTKMLRNGRMDLDIVVLDAQGDIVALSNHVALVVGAERNLSARGNGNGNGKTNGKENGAKI